MTITPTTEKEAVNLILRGMGEAPVSNLVGDITIEATQALSTLRDVSREVQSRGWFFNREFTTLTPDNDGYLVVPGNALSIISMDTSRPVQPRGTRLYNMTPYSHGYVFDAALKVEVIYGLPFDELPESARTYITHRANRINQAIEQGDELSLREDSQDEQNAMAVMKAEQLRAEPKSLKQAQSVSRITHTGYYGRSLSLQ